MSYYMKTVMLNNYCVSAIVIGILRMSESKLYCVIINRNHELYTHNTFRIITHVLYKWKITVM